MAHKEILPRHTHYISPPHGGKTYLGLGVLDRPLVFAQLKFYYINYTTPDAPAKAAFAMKGLTGPNAHISALKVTCKLSPSSQRRPTVLCFAMKNINAFWEKYLCF